MAASSDTRVTIMKLLLEAGADPEAADDVRSRCCIMKSKCSRKNT
jgi:hypothetical protein